MKTQSRRNSYFVILFLLTFAACNGSSNNNTTTPITPTTFTIGGTLLGLSNAIILQNNETDDLSLSADGTFVFSTALADSTAYSVTILGDLVGQTCTITNGTGTVSGANVTDIEIECSPIEWRFQSYLKAPNTSDGDIFGWPVSLDGDTLAVGSFAEQSTTTAIINGADLSATNDDGTDNGAVYVFKRSGSAWSHEAYLKAPNTSNGDFFGAAVAVADDTIVVGAYQEDSDTTAIISGSDLSATNDDGDNNGAVYVFKRSGSIWSHEAYLKAPNTSNDDSFGVSVSIDTDTVAVGAYQEDSDTTDIINGSDLSAANDDGDDNGAVYVFKRNGSIWSHEAYLKAPNTSNNDRFSDGDSSISLDGDTIAVGAYQENSTTTAIINGADLSATNNAGNNNGAVYVFKRSGSTWTHEAYLKPPNTSNGDSFGFSVSVNGDTMAVGALSEDSNTTSIINGTDLSSINDDGDENGAVYVFKRSGSTWVHEAYLKAPNTSNVDRFGFSVSVDGDTIAVGANAEQSSTTAIINGSDLSSTNNDGVSHGAVYVFNRSDSTWTHEAYLKAPNSSSDRFGYSVSVDDNTIAVGADREDSNTTDIINGTDLSAANEDGSNNGAVYVFTKE